jgi:hypothetical protein
MIGVCTGPGPCIYPIHSSLLCTTHLKQSRTGRPLVPIKSDRKPTACPGPECDRLAVEGVYCRTHARQFRAGRPLTPIRQHSPRGDGTCPGPGTDGPCGRAIHSRGHCSAHAAQQRRGEQLHIIGAPFWRGCDVAGCDAKHFGRGLCALHLRRLRAGKPMNPPPKPTACVVCGRDEIHGRDMCARCYHAYWRELKGRPPRVRKSKPASNLPEGWLRKTVAKPRPEPSSEGGDGLNMYLLMQIPELTEEMEARVDDFRGYLTRRGETDILAMLFDEVAS